jgi:hypothetical protein
MVGRYLNQASDKRTKNHSGECAHQAFAASWCIALITSAATMRRSAPINGLMMSDWLIKSRDFLSGVRPGFQY